MGALRLVRGTPLAGSYPAAVVSTGTQAIYDLRLSGTGPRSAPTKNFSSNSAELTSVGAFWGTNGSDYLEFPSSCTLTGWDFTGLNRTIFIWGTRGDVTFVDCKFDNTSTFLIGNSNGNNPHSTSTAVGIFNYCDINNGYVGISYGGTRVNYCTFRNANVIYLQTFGSSGNVEISIDHCYMIGGGLNLPANAHAELIQHASPGTFSCTNTLMDISNQASVDPRPQGGRLERHSGSSLRPAEAARLY